MLHSPLKDSCKGKQSLVLTRDEGSPAIWSPPKYPRKLNPDKGEVFIDQNAARFGAFPMEPMFRAMWELQSDDCDLSDIEVVVDRNSLAKLFDFVTASSRSFVIDVEVIRNTAVFIRREKQNTEFINEFRGFGRTFPEEYMTWGSDVKGSSSHHRIARFQLGGMKYLMRFESDGYLTEKAGITKKAPSPLQGTKADLDIATDLLAPGNSLNIAETQSTEGGKLFIRRQGSEIDQQAVLDIKTRASKKLLDMESVLPRLWMSQTTNLIAAYHEGGRFADIRILDVGKEIEQWKERHEIELRKLDTLVRCIIAIVKDTNGKKCRLKRREGGKLEVREFVDGLWSALPEDVIAKFKWERDDGEEDDRSEHRKDAESYLEYVDDDD